MIRGLHRWLVLGAAFVAALALACGQILVIDEEQEAAPQAAGDSGQAAPVSRGGELRLLASDPPNLDPAIAGDVTSSQFIVEVFSGLVMLNERLEVAPDMAKEWTVSADGTVYTFTLRDNLRFHNNRPVTADDFKFSLERALDPDTASPTAESYLNDIIGAVDMINGRATDVSGIEVLDPLTLRITIDSPKVYFLSKLTYPTAYVVDRNQVDRPNWFERPNGTGPFKLTEYSRGDRLILERNERFYLDPPSLSSVLFFLSGAAITRYENDEIDISPVGLIDIDRIRDPNEPLSKEFVETDELSTFYIGFNVNKQPFDDVHVRRALNFAAEKRRIGEVVLRELYSSAAGILPPGMPGYDPNLKGLEYDPDKARAELAQSKYGDAEALGRITFSTAGQAASIGPTLEAILANWEENLGVEVEIQQTEWAIYLQDLARDRYQIFDAGWSADYPDPEDFLDLLLHSESPLNHTNYSNPDFDALVERARTESDQNVRLELYREAEKLAIQDAAWLPLFHPRRYEVVKPYVRGYKPAAMTIPYLSRISLDRR